MHQMRNHCQIIFHLLNLIYKNTRPACKICTSDLLCLTFLKISRMAVSDSLSAIVTGLASAFVSTSNGVLWFSSGWSTEVASSNQHPTNIHVMHACNHINGSEIFAIDCISEWAYSKRNVLPEVFSGHLGGCISYFMGGVDVFLFEISREAPHARDCSHRSFKDKSRWRFEAGINQAGLDHGSHSLIWSTIY